MFDWDSLEKLSEEEKMEKFRQHLNDLKKRKQSLMGHWEHTCFYSFNQNGNRDIILQRKIQMKTSCLIRSKCVYKQHTNSW